MLELKAPKIIKKILFKEVHKKFGSHFDFFVLGGAPFPEEEQKFWESMGFKTIQGYGLTESSPVLTANKLDKQKRGSAGLTLPGVEIKIAKDGEILAKGKNITQGYYKEKVKTKELFEKGWMRTGDIGYFDDEGFLFLKGRKVHMIVTSSGMNIFPADIEEVFDGDNRVKDVCVLGVPADGGEQVHAELLLDEPDTDVKSIIADANKKLNQSQQILSYDVWPGEDFPRTTTMKVKKKMVLKEIQKREHEPDHLEGVVTTHSKLFRILAKVSKVDINKIKLTSNLALDLKLSSVHRVELISYLEDAFHVDIDDDYITDKTTVKDIEDFVMKRKKAEHKEIFKRWSLHPFLRILRYFFKAIIINNAVRLFCDRTVLGKENLKGVKGPLIIVSNHTSLIDMPNIYMTLPFKIKTKLATAAARDIYDIKSPRISEKTLGWIYQYLGVTFFNIYLFARKQGFKKSLEYTGELLDKGWSILLFPEGDLSTPKKMKSFKSGIGWLIQEMKVPILPIRIEGPEKIMPRDSFFPKKRDKVLIKIGKPIMMDHTKSITALTKEVQDIIEKM
jgi:long-chain acyl-CoA synthetase